MNETALRSLRLALASLIAVALTAQLLIGMTDADLTVVRFLSFFTVLSNAMAAVTLTLLALDASRDTRSVFATFRGAVTVYMSVTGLVWAVVLAPNYVDVAVPEPWIDISIHVIAPLAIILDWLLHPPPVTFSRGVLGIWMIFPGAYLIYSLVRGAVVDWYPYPFLDPGDQGGYGGVAIGVIVVAAVILAFSYAYRWWANRKTGEAA